MFPHTYHEYDTHSSGLFSFSNILVLLDAKRDLRDLGLEEYADEKCYNLAKAPYGSLDEKYEDGVMFATYQTLIAKNRQKQTRLDQLVEWCGGEEFDGLIMLDECHKAKTIELDAKGNPKMTGRGLDKKEKSSQTAIKVVELQNLLPRARIVYCSATSVSHPKVRLDMGDYVVDLVLDCTCWYSRMVFSLFVFILWIEPRLHESFGIVGIWHRAPPWFQSVSLAMFI